jgi:hypothetical protein
MNGDKRKFLFVSITGLISDIAWQVAKEGHEVRYCIEDEKERDVADDFVPKVRDWEREVSWAQAQAQAYSRIRNIMIPDMYYRDDIGERWFEDHDKLHTWGTCARFNATSLRFLNRVGATVDEPKRPSFRLAPIPY